MYNTKVVCKYNNYIFENLRELEHMTETDKEYFLTDLYREEFLNIFGLYEYDETKINQALDELYEKIKDCKELKECMLKLASNIMSLDEEIGMLFLFSYDYMYLSHICICEFLETGQISQDNISKLKSKILV
jgi:hypothetical protein